MSATKTLSHGAPYTVPPEPNRTPAILLAVAVHAALLAFLWVGISWQNHEPVAVEAEVWDMKLETAAAPLPPPPPPKRVEPEPAPEPKPTPPPKAAEPEPVRPSAPDIKLEREKKLAEQKKERERRELIEKREREEQEKRELAEQKKLAEKKLAEKKKELEKEKEKLEKEKKLAAEKQEADKKKLADEKAAKAKAEKAEQAKLDKLRADELKRLMGAAGSTGNAQKSTGPKTDPSYVAKLTALIKSNTNYAVTDDAGNPRAVFKVELLPTGEILSVRLVKSSGVPQFDAAVERGINKSSPLPKKKDGTVDRTLDVGFSMKDLN